MTDKNKTSKARKLFELADSHLMEFPPIRPGAPEQFRRIAESVRTMTRDLRIELIEKHYSQAQLDALIAFYETGMGESILQSRQALEQEFKARFKEVLDQQKPDSDGGLKEIIIPRDPDEDA